MTQANLDELNQALEDFNAAKPGPRTATAARAAQTESLPALASAESACGAGESIKTGA